MYKNMSSYLAVSVLAAGAALTVGLLTFSGMFAILPLLPLDLVAMILAVAYEGEVYVQNIRGAWDKLFKPRHHERMIAKAFLREHTPAAGTQRPQFFEDLLNALELLDKYEHAKNPEYDEKIQSLTEQIDRMEEYFTNKLFPEIGPNDLHMDNYEEHELDDWLAGKSPQAYCVTNLYHLKKQQSISQATEQPRDLLDLKTHAQARLDSEKQSFSILKWVSIFAGIAMGLGTTYLLVEAFTVLPIFVFLPVAFWPILIVPLTIIAGAAYGLLTYNALTDMWHNKTLQSWLTRLQSDWTNKRTYTTIMIAVGTTLLLALTIALTICTAGTWWTIVKEVQPVFLWMKAVPIMVFQLILAILVGAATLMFNIQNTMETLEFFYEKLPQLMTAMAKKIAAWPDMLFNHISNETTLQLINPFRVLRILIVEPLRYLLFIGHLISEAFGSTRLPGVPDAWSTTFGFVSNFFQDFLYFFNEDDLHDHSEAQLLNDHFDAAGHDHADDLPTKFLNTLFYPVLQAEIMWHNYFNDQKNQPTQQPDNLSAIETKLKVTLFSNPDNKYEPSQPRSSAPCPC